MLPAIDRLAHEIDGARARVRYAEETFCNIAASSLARPLGLDFTTVARCLCEGGVLPEQRRSDRAFGQPALTLYHGERFFIEALSSHSGTSAIHQHSFSGAFRVLTGRVCTAATRSPRRLSSLPA
jgi:hypothetical protein